MTRPLGTAPSIPREGTPQTPLNMEAMRGGGAAPNVWLTLANRIAWQQACAQAEQHTLIFDSHDQARLA